VRDVPRAVRETTLVIETWSPLTQTDAVKLRGTLTLRATTSRVVARVSRRDLGQKLVSATSPSARILANLIKIAANGDRGIFRRFLDDPVSKGAFWA